MKKETEQARRRGRHILFSCVFLVLGFILASSYKTLGKDAREDKPTSELLAAEEKYREDLIEQQERNRELSDDISVKQEEIRKHEQSFSDLKEDHANLVEQASDLRLLLGVVPTTGTGIRVTLMDAEYDPTEQNPNDYIVHESHVFRVINELRVSGAQGLAINGQRLTANSYIKCTGPVITVDGKTFPAPFVIEAIGESDVLEDALRLKGGVIDSLVLDNIVVSTEQVKKLDLAIVGNES